MENLEKGLIAIGFAILLIVISQAVSIGNCHGCTACSGLDIVNPVCQASYAACTTTGAACSANSWLVSMVFLWFGIAILFYGIVRIIW